MQPISGQRLRKHSRRNEYTDNNRIICHFYATARKHFPIIAWQ
jgi:hypothetical protein